MIKLQAIGNVGKEAKVNETNGRKAINFNVAENQKYKDAEGVQHEKTTWINCTIWRESNQSTEIAKYLKPGTKVFIEGLPSVDTYQNKEGKTVANINLNVKQVELLSAKDKEEKKGNDTEVVEANAILDDKTGKSHGTYEDIPMK